MRTERARRRAGASGVRAVHHRAGGAAGILLVLALTGCVGADHQTLSVLIDAGPAGLKTWDALAAAYHEATGVEIKLETRPSGGEGDNIVKTRLATGDMTDLFVYNPGSLLRALNPDQSLVDMSGEAWVDTVDPQYRSVVSTPDGMYGLPVGTTGAGAVIYNKRIYAELGLDVPQTWDEFMANNAVIDRAGYTPVVQTYGDPWTAQLWVLGDFYNVAAEDPTWAERYTEGTAKYHDLPARAGFDHLQQIYDEGYLNATFASASATDAVRMLADGEGVHYPTLTGNFAYVLEESAPEAADSIGAFAIPGERADENGLTIWMPNGIYIPRTTSGDTLEAARDFVAWLASSEGCRVQLANLTVSGPHVIDGCEADASALPMIDDLETYYDEGRVGLALEFLSPIKGPSLEQIAVEVGSGIRSAQSGADLYDQDVVKQAEQLGLEWGS